MRILPRIALGRDEDPSESPQQEHILTNKGIPGEAGILAAAIWKVLSISGVMWPPAHVEAPDWRGWGMPFHPTSQR